MGATKGSVAGIWRRRQVPWPLRTDGALVRVSTPVSGGVAETTDVLVRYIQALYPVLADYLPE